MLTWLYSERRLAFSLNLPPNQILIGDFLFKPDSAPHRYMYLQTSQATPYIVDLINVKKSEGKPFGNYSTCFNFVSIFFAVLEKGSDMSR